MALKRTIETRAGVTVKDAYAKVTRIAGSKDRGFNVSVCYFKDKAASDADKPPAEHINYRMPFVEQSNADNVIAESYIFLKKQDDFSGAVDC